MFADTKNSNMIIRWLSALVLGAAICLAMAIPISQFTGFLIIAPVGIMACFQLFARDRFSTHLIDLWSRLSLPLALFIGATSALLLEIVGVSILPALVSWLGLLSVVISILSSTAQTSRRILIFLALILPIVLMLISTSAMNLLAVAGLLVGLTAFPFLVFARLQQIQSVYQAKLIVLEQNCADAIHARNEALHRARHWTWRIDDRYRLVAASPNAGEIFDFKSDLFFPEIFSNGQTADLVNLLDQQAKFDRFDVRIVNSNQDYWFSISAKPIFSKTGIFEGYEGWAGDISPVISAREKQRTFQNVLEQKVHHRTHILDAEIEKLRMTNARMTRKLQQSQQMSRRICRRVTEAAKDVVESSEFAPEPQAKMHQRLHHLQRYVDELPVLVSLINDKSPDIRSHDTQSIDGFSVICIDTLLEEMIHQASQLAERHDVRIILSSLCGVQVFADSTKLRHALNELIRSTILRAEKGSVVRVSVEMASDQPTIRIVDEAQTIDHDLTKKLQGSQIDNALDFSAQTSDDQFSLVLASALLTSQNLSLEIAAVDQNKGNVLDITLPRARILSQSA